MPRSVITALLLATLSGVAQTNAAEEPPGDEALNAAFERYLQAQRQALALYQASPFFDLSLIHI